MLKTLQFWAFGLLLGALGSGLPRPVRAAPEVQEIGVNRVFDVLPDPAQSGTLNCLRTAAKELGTWRLFLGGLRISGASLGRVADRMAAGEPYLRAVREQLRLPIDGHDFLLFLDDVLLAGREGLRDGVVHIPSARARKAGILLHPDDVFEPINPRVYGGASSTLSIAAPKRKAGVVRAKDGEVLGPNWRLRYRNPSGTRAKLSALSKVRPKSTFRQRIESLLDQLRTQGSTAYVTSTVRRRERGYLMWGAYHISQGTDENDVNARVTTLEARNEAWGLDLPIRWRHPDGWEATQTARAGDA